MTYGVCGPGPGSTAGVVDGVMAQRYGRLTPLIEYGEPL